MSTPAAPPRFSATWTAVAPRGIGINKMDKLLVEKNGNREVWTRLSELTDEELGVDYVLDGSVRWARGEGGSRVRITPQLVRTSDDTQMWASSYDRVIEDVSTTASAST